MAGVGRIVDEDVALVRDRVRIDDVVREYVALKPAGGGSLKGLCPFHDEKSPSFHVTPSKGMYYCFGCQSGGDAISFLRAMHPELTFTESVERLAALAGVEVRYREGSYHGEKKDPTERARLLAANRMADEFYRSQYATEEARRGREFLAAKGFTDEDARAFAIGYAPRGWDTLTRELLKKGVAREDLILAGLSTEGNRGTYDKFRGRLIWPIRDISGDTIGFGARKIYDDDEGPKYLNTAETPLYKKSQALYGLDLAKKQIGKEHKVVVVEGYSDVMACHLAGVKTAVAACGTAFGDGHIRTIRRLIGDGERGDGKVIFTFDGDAAGQKAALKAFENESKWEAQTFVVVAPEGMDPCEYRQRDGDSALSELIDSAVPLFEFAIKNILSKYDLDTSEGRIVALREAAPVLSAIKDPALRPEYVRRTSGWLGMDIQTVSRALSSGRTSRQMQQEEAGRPVPAASTRGQIDPIEREALKCILQEPRLSSHWYSAIEATSFSDPSSLAVFVAVDKLGGPSAAGPVPTWVENVVEACEEGETQSLIRSLVVEPLAVTGEVSAGYVNSVIGRLLEASAERRIKELRGAVQRASAAGQDVTDLMATMMSLETYKRDVQEEMAKEL